MLQVPESIRPMLDCGLLEVLSRTLVAVAHIAPQNTDMCGISEQDILFGDIHVFLVTLSAHVLHTPGAHHMQVSKLSTLSSLFDKTPLSHS